MKDSNTLVIISNQYMLSQFEWYHDQNNEDKCDAVIINFNSENLVKIMKDRCRESKKFNNIYIYNNQIYKLYIYS